MRWGLQDRAVQSAGLPSQRIPHALPVFAYIWQRKRSLTGNNFLYGVKEESALRRVRTEKKGICASERGLAPSAQPPVPLQGGATGRHFSPCVPARPSARHAWPRTRGSTAAGCHPHGVAWEKDGGEGGRVYTGSRVYPCFSAAQRCGGRIYRKLDRSHSAVQNNPLFNLSGSLKAWV